MSGIASAIRGDSPPEPLLPLHLLRSRQLVGGCLATAANSATYVAVIVIGSLHLQSSLGLSAGKAGIALTASLLGVTLSGLAAAAAVRRLGCRRVAAAALGLGALALGLLSGTVESALALILVLFFVRGVSGGFAYVALTRACVGDAAEPDRSTTAGIFEATTHLAGAVAVAVYIALIGAGLGYGAAYAAGAAFAIAGVVAALVFLRREDRVVAAP